MVNHLMHYILSYISFNNDKQDISWLLIFYKLTNIIKSIIFSKGNSSLLHLMRFFTSLLDFKEYSI